MAEEKKQTDERKQAEERRLEEERKRADERQQADERRLAEEKKRADERKLNEERLLADKRARTAKTILQFRGSTTVGYALAPELAKAFLESDLKASQVESREPEPGHFFVQGMLSDHPSLAVIEVVAKGSGEAFSKLQSGEADIGMASRRVKPEEAGQLKSLGDMTGKACEHIVALDGIAIVVHNSNPTVHATVEQIRNIFLGEIRDWSEIGSGTTGSINLYVRDEVSGTHDSFQAMVMKGKKASPNVLVVDSAEDMDERVAKDVNGIGYTGLPYVKGCKALRIAEKGTSPLAATKLTVRSENYALARRLFLYTPANPQNQWTKRFIKFAESDAGQEIAEKVGFVGQTWKPIVQECPKGAPDDYCKMTRNAEQLPFNFRFNPNSTELDNKASRDVLRLLTLMDQPQNRNRRIMLIGFADSRGNRDNNLRLSRDRAKYVAAELKEEGLNNLETGGFGQNSPLVIMIRRKDSKRTAAWRYGWKSNEPYIRFGAVCPSSAFGWRHN